MYCLILAAGRGQRLRPLTDDIPKCLVELHGVPILKHTLVSLKERNLNSNTVTVSGYQHHVLDKFLTSFGFSKSIYNHQWSSCNIGGSLLKGLHSMNTNEGVLVFYGDIIFESSALDLALSKVRLNNQCSFVIASTNWKDLWSARFIDPLSDAESFYLNDNNQIYEIGQPLSCTDLLPDYQFTGIYYLSPDIVRLLLSDHNKFFHQSSTDILNHFCRFKTINAVPWAGEWIEIDTPSDITVSLNQRLSLSRLIKSDLQ